MEEHKQLIKEALGIINGSEIISPSMFIKILAISEHFGLTSSTKVYKGRRGFCVEWPEMKSSCEIINNNRIEFAGEHIFKTFTNTDSFYDYFSSYLDKKGVKKEDHIFLSDEETMVKLRNFLLLRKEMENLEKELSQSKVQYLRTGSAGFFVGSDNYVRLGFGRIVFCSTNDYVRYLDHPCVKEGLLKLDCF